jgi:hypothetical protein
MLNSTTASNVTDGAPSMRVSEVLRGILSNNPDVETFSVERILDSVGRAGFNAGFEADFDASLMLFALPAMFPVPRPRGMVALPAGAIACQMIAGRKQIRLPRFIRKKSISRKALAVAIHAVLPVLEAAEKVVRPRWTWVDHPIWRRLVGLFVLLMVIAIAFPLFGFNCLHATSIFVISLGMAEKDGLAVLIGVVAGAVALAIVASGVSSRAVRTKVARWLWKLSRRLGLGVLASYLDRLGHAWLARILRFRWSNLLLGWDPEKRAAEAAARSAAPAAAVPTPRPQAQHRGPTADRAHRVAELARRTRASSVSTAEASLSSALA